VSGGKVAVAAHLPRWNCSSCSRPSPDFTVEDLSLIWGPSDFGRRAPPQGRVDFFGQNIPSYDLF
jgi:hypothetical protein